MFDIQLTAQQTARAYQGNWREIKIVDNLEPLVIVPNDCCIPFYHVQGLTADSRLWLRQGAFDKFMLARTNALGYGCDLRLLDGWRSVDLQFSLFWDYMKKFTAPIFQQGDLFVGVEGSDAIKTAFETLSTDLQDKMTEHNKNYVSIPSTLATAPSPHATGGCADTWLYDLRGNALDFGVDFDDMSSKAGTFYHLEGDREKFANDDEVCFNRTLMIQLMVEAGYTTYPYEFWHFNTMCQMDCLVTGEVATYSYIEPTV